MKARNPISAGRMKSRASLVSSRFFGLATGVSQARDLNVSLRFNF